MTDILFSSLLTLSLGSLLSLPLISSREIGRGFFTLWVAVVGTLDAAALALLAFGGAVGAPGADGARVRLLLVLSLVSMAAFWVLLRLGAHRSASAALILSAVFGALVLREIAIAPAQRGTAPGLASASASPPHPAEIALRVTSGLASALAVGTVTVAMVLGHWYLVQPKLKLAPLRRLSDILIGVLMARLIVTGWGLATSLRAGHRFLGTGEPVPWELLILSQRFLFGFGGALILAVMIRKTVALRSTMSATGLLYIAILFVWVGEFLSIYLGRLTGGVLVV